jgi:hypothetical protein
MPRKTKHTPATFLENLAFIRAHALKNDWTRFVTLILFFSFMLGTTLTSLTIQQVSAATASKPPAPTVASLSRDMAALAKRINDVNGAVRDLSDRVNKLETTPPSTAAPYVNDVVSMMPDGASSTMMDSSRRPQRLPMDGLSPTGTRPMGAARLPRQTDTTHVSDACRQQCVDSLANQQVDSTDPTYTARVNRCVASNCQ